MNNSDINNVFIFETKSAPIDTISNKMLKAWEEYNQQTKFINDPDLDNNMTPYGKEWKEICQEEWATIITSTCCPKSGCSCS